MDELVCANRGGGVATILAELLPLERFERIDQIIAFAGIDPSVKQTGGKRGTHWPISKRGSPTLREALFLAAFGSFSKGCTDPLICRRMQPARGLHSSANQMWWSLYQKVRTHFQQNPE